MQGQHMNPLKYMEGRIYEYTDMREKIQHWIFNPV
jgi:hypothetical protein